MDEILASIRRIIESGDERDGANGGALLSISPEGDGQADPRAEDGPAVASALVSPVPAFDIRYERVALGEEALVARHLPDVPQPPVERAAVEMDELDAPAEDEPDAPAAEVADIETPSAAAASVDDVSDDAWWDAVVADANDVEAEVESANGPTSPAAIDTQAGTHVPPPDNENAASPADPDLLRSNWSEPPARPVSPEPEVALRQPVMASAIHAAPAHATGEPGAPEMLAPFSPPEGQARPELPESVIAGASALLSTQAGDQVAAAFDDLTRAIREGHMRSMEGMAREIMRPMLQEWLDDNLPRIVERLVREEIERIARGPRR